MKFKSGIGSFSQTAPQPIALISVKLSKFAELQFVNLARPCPQFWGNAPRR